MDELSRERKQIPDCLGRARFLESRFRLFGRADQDVAVGSRNEIALPENQNSCEKPLCGFQEHDLAANRVDSRSLVEEFQ